MDPFAAKLILDELAQLNRRFDESDRLFDEFHARIAQCLSHTMVVPEQRDTAVELRVGDLSPTTATQFIAADNWGGLFDGDGDSIAADSPLIPTVFPKPVPEADTASIGSDSEGHPSVPNRALVDKLLLSDGEDEIPSVDLSAPPTLFLEEQHADGREDLDEDKGKATVFPEGVPISMRHRDSAELPRLTNKVGRLTDQHEKFERDGRPRPPWSRRPWELLRVADRGALLHIRTSAADRGKPLRIDEEGLHGSWFAAAVLDFGPVRCCCIPARYAIEYAHLPAGFEGVLADVGVCAAAADLHDSFAAAILDFGPARGCRNPARSAIERAHLLAVVLVETFATLSDECAYHDGCCAPYLLAKLASTPRRQLGTWQLLPRWSWLLLGSRQVLTPMKLMWCSMKCGKGTSSSLHLHRGWDSFCRVIVLLQLMVTRCLSAQITVLLELLLVMVDKGPLSLHWFFNWKPPWFSFRYYQAAGFYIVVVPSSTADYVPTKCSMCCCSGFTSMLTRTLSSSTPIWMYAEVVNSCDKRPWPPPSQAQVFREQGMHRKVDGKLLDAESNVIWSPLWPSPHTQVEFGYDSVAIRPSPWLSFILRNRIAVGSGVSWEPPWTLQPRQDIRCVPATALRELLTCMLEISVCIAAYGLLLELVQRKCGASLLQRYLDIPVLISSLVARGGTNVPHGFKMGAIVLSDDHHVKIQTFSFGSDHDSYVVHAIFDFSSGPLSFIIDAEGSIQDGSVQSIGGILGAMVQEIQLCIERAGNGVLHSSTKSDEERSFLVTLGLRLVPVQYRPPWPPPNQLEMWSDGVHRWPIPWPSFIGSMNQGLLITIHYEFNLQFWKDSIEILGTAQVDWLYLIHFAAVLWPSVCQCGDHKHHNLLLLGSESWSTAPELVTRLECLIIWFPEQSKTAGKLTGFNFSGLGASRISRRGECQYMCTEKLPDGARLSGLAVVADKRGSVIREKGMEELETNYFTLAFYCSSSSPSYPLLLLLRRDPFLPLFFPNSM